MQKFKRRVLHLLRVAAAESHQLRQQHMSARKQLSSATLLELYFQGYPYTYPSWQAAPVTYEQAYAPAAADTSVPPPPPGPDAPTAHDANTAQQVWCVLLSSPPICYFTP